MLPEEEYRPDPTLVAAALEALEVERSMTFRQVFTRYKKAALWSAFLSMALVMEGYDVGVINSFWGQTAFLNTFGSEQNGTKYIPANWQAAINNGACVGQVAGLLINGWAQAKYGSKKVYLAAMVAMVGAIFIPVFSTSLGMLFAGEIVCGIPWGVFQTLTTAYAAEICPTAMRMYLTAFINMCWGFGLFLSAGVVRAFLPIVDKWGWKIPYMIQWVWPVPLFIVGLFAPESPAWFVRQGRLDDARKALSRLGRDDYLTEEILNHQIALLQHTNDLEKLETKGATYMDCFKGSNLRRTEIVCAVWSVQYWCGQPIQGYSTQFLEQAGLTAEKSFDIYMGLNSMYIVGTICAWGFLSKFGRRTVYLWGQAWMALLLGIIGILGFINKTGAVMAIGSLMVCMNFVYNASLGPACFTIVGEMPSGRVRPHTIVLARIAYVISNIICNQLTPRMIGTTDGTWGWGARCGLFWLGTNLLSWTYCYFRLPETRGRTFAELDMLFTDKVPARGFARADIRDLNRFEYVMDTKPVEVMEQREEKSGEDLA